MKTIQKIAVASLVAGLATAAGDASAAVAYLVIEGIVGTSKVIPGSIDLASVDFSATATIDSETGLASGKRQFSPIVVQKQVDASSVSLVAMFLAGTQRSAIISFVNFGGGPGGATGASPPYLRIQLTGALVSAYSLSSAGDQPTESISFNYTTIEEIYSPPVGTIGAGGSVTYNLATGGP